MRFLKNSDPKKLNIRQVYELHKLLGGWNGKALLVDEVLETLKKMTGNKFLKTIHIMFDSVSTNEPTSLAVMFISGVKNTKFFEFQKFMETINARPR